MMKGLEMDVQRMSHTLVGLGGCSLWLLLMNCCSFTSSTGAMLRELAAVSARHNAARDVAALAARALAHHAGVAEVRTLNDDSNLVLCLPARLSLRFEIGSFYLGQGQWLVAVLTLPWHFVWWLAGA